MLCTTDTAKSIWIHFLLRGVTSTIEVSTPTHSEYQSLPRIKLTSQDLEWDPQNPDFAAQENMFFNHFGEFNPPGDRNSADC